MEAGITNPKHINDRKRNTCLRCAQTFLTYFRLESGRYLNCANRKLCFECNPLKSGKHYAERTPACEKCGATEPSGKWCDSCYRNQRRWAHKRRAVELLGGKCNRCSWSGHIAGYDFHHPADDKEFTPSQMLSFSWEKFWSEAQKCELLCAICHRIEHSKFEEEPHEGIEGSNQEPQAS
jgi:hypothetical protein